MTRPVPRALRTTLVTMAIAILGPFSAGAQSPDSLDLTPEELAWVADNPVLRLSPAPTFPPIEFFDDRSQYVGIAADYAALLASRTGLRFEVTRRDSWDDVLLATQDRDVDVWMEAGITDERREYMLFTEPYLHVPAGIIVQRQMEGIETLDDLVGRRVAVVDGYASSEYVRSRYPQLQLVPVPSIQNGVERVAFGSVDALVANIAAASFYAESANLTNLRVAGESGFVWELALGTRSDWPILHGVLVKALDSISDDERRTISRRWIALEAEDRDFPITGFEALLLALLLIGIVVGIRFLLSHLSGTSQPTDRGALLDSWPIIAVSGVAIVLVIAGAVRAQSLLTERARSDVGNTLRTVLNSSSNAVYDWFREREGEAAAWTTRDDIQEYAIAVADATRSDPPMDASDAVRGLHRALNAVGGTGAHQGFLLLGTDGQVLTASDALAADSLQGTHAELAQRVQSSSGHTAFALPRSNEGSTDDALRSILVGSAVVDATGTVHAVLALEFDPAGDFSTILHRGQLGASGESYAINHYGELISASRFGEQLVLAGLVEKGQNEILGITVRDPGGDLLTGFRPQQDPEDWPLTRMASSAVAGESDIDLDGYNDYRGTPVIGAWVWDDTSGMGIAAEIDVGEAYAFLRSYQQQTWLATSLAVALLTALTGLFIRSRSRMAAANMEIEKAYATIKRHKDRMEKELNVGREIQMSMVPLTFPAFPERTEFSIKASLNPAREVGGDLYDFFFIDDNLFCFCIGDVSGKGVGAALFMAVTKTLVKSRAVGGHASTADIVKEVNDELSANNAEAMFVSLFICILDLRTGELAYTNAGHNPPYLKRRDALLRTLDTLHGPVVGAVEDLEYSAGELSLQPGDLLVLFTDGVTEAFNVQGELYSDSRLENLIRSEDFADADACVDVITDDITRFAHGAEQSDDITVLAMEFHGQR